MTELKSLILCEGPDDRRVVECLLEEMKVEQVDVEAYDGKDKLRKKLDEIKNSPEFAQGVYTKVLVTRDADDDWSSAWQSVRDAIDSKIGVRFDDVNQWAPINEDTRVAAWIFPGKEQTGMIETLCLDVARETQPEAFECLDQYAECLEANHRAVMHEKSRFAIWTISAQSGENARKIWNLRDVLRRLPFDWSNQKFTEIRAVLSGISSS